MFDKISISGQKTYKTLMCYSRGSIGLRSPYCPSGVVFRETGQSELYSGISKVVLDASGAVGVLSDFLGIRSSSIRIKVPDLESFKINNKGLNSSLEKNSFVLRPKVDLNGFKVIGPQSYVQVDPGTGIGEIVNPVPIIDLFEVIPLLLDHKEKDEKKNYIFNEVSKFL